MSGTYRFPYSYFSPSIVTSSRHEFDREDLDGKKEGDDEQDKGDYSTS